MAEIIVCSKCNGTGEYHFRNGVIGHCYQCNGKGRMKRTSHKKFLITIVDNGGERIDWINVSARSKTEAVRKAETIAGRGCYRDQIDTIEAHENGVEYTYSHL